MTTHELAAILQSMPNIDVGYYKYIGGEEEFKEVKEVTIEVITGYCLLKTYKGEE